MDPNISKCAEANDFTLTDSQKVTEIDGVAHVMRHRASGARLLYLKNDDANKAFAITFKTPAADNTGVFHILEHSVLCGSDKFPVKEPFLNLLKSSMQTFLNAMTFPDKTMYPVASTNEQDLMNLMDVYMDAVFHPQIYSKRTIFEQEGWHYESSGPDIDGQDSGANCEGLTYNGVVFNEMKGALSDPDSVLYDVLSAALFPDTTYRFESGGIPENITDLTYEGFLENHARHYRPDNCYITLYGNMDINKFLEFLDREYLSPLSEVERALPNVNKIGFQQPVVATGVKHTMVTASENASDALGFVIGQAKDRERVLAAGILIDAIAGSNEAPLKRAVLDAGLADDMYSSIGDSIAQPFVCFELRGLREGAANRFLELVRQETQKLADGGLDRSLIEASLSHTEFVMREHNLGYPDGVIYAMSSMSGWLYDENMPLGYIPYEEAFKSLRARISEGYFEQLLRELFIENDHYAEVELVPVSGDAEAWEAAKLKAASMGMSQAEYDAIAEEEKALRTAQSSPDSPEDLKKLPYLSISDIEDAPDFPQFGVVPESDPVCLRHDISSHGIAYFYRYFDLDGISFDDMPYVSILALVLGRISTEEHTAAEIDRIAQGKLGNLNFYTDIYEDVKGNSFHPKFVVSSSALSANVDVAATLTNEILSSTTFCDYDKLMDILLQRRVAMEQGFANAGHVVAMQRATSYYSRAALLREQLSGIDFYLFLKRLIENFESEKELLADKLNELCRHIFVDDRMMLSFTGSDEDLARYLDAGATLGISAAKTAEGLSVPEPTDKREAFIVPTDITYTAVSANRQNIGEQYSGSWQVAARVISYDYLWHEVRVIGGAYGTGFQTTIPGVSRFYSYRDPHVDETIMRFRNAGKWLSEFSPDDREFTGYIVSSVAGFDNPLKPRDLMRKQDGMYFTGYSVEDRKENREQVIHSTVRELNELGRSIEALAKFDHICTVGNAEVIQQSKEGFNIVELIS